MKLLFDATTGKPYYAVYDSDWFKFRHTTNIPLTEFEIDEVDPDNKDICFNLSRNTHRVNADGDGKYYLTLNGDVWELHEREGWEEYQDGL